MSQNPSVDSHPGPGAADSHVLHCPVCLEKTLKQTLEEVVPSLQQKIEQVERNRKGLQERLAKRIVEAKQDTTRLKKEVDEETAKQLEARQQHESFMRQSAEERERARLDIEETTSKLADLKQTNETMKAQIDELARLKVAREEELRNYRAQVESYESDRGGILARCKELGREGDVLAVRRNSLQLEYDGLLSSLKSLQEHHDSAKAEYDELDASTATLTDDLNARRRERDAASEDFVALHEEVVCCTHAHAVSV